MDGGEYEGLSTLNGTLGRGDVPTNLCGPSWTTITGLASCGAIHSARFSASEVYLMCFIFALNISSCWTVSRAAHTRRVEELVLELRPARGPPVVPVLAPGEAVARPPIQPSREPSEF
jgi:hypothetical protein